VRWLPLFLIASGCVSTWAIQKGHDEVTLRTGMRREDVEKELGAPRREWSADPNAYARRMLYEVGGKEWVIRYTDERVDAVRPAIKVYDHAPPAKCKELAPVKSEVFIAGQYALDEARLELEDAANAQGGNSVWLQSSNTTDRYSQTAPVNVKMSGTAFLCPL
jgi:hypothetical protein